MTSDAISEPIPGSASGPVSSPVSSATAGPVSGPTSDSTSAPIDLVIFDCDGVLLDSERIAVRVDALVLADLGCPMTEQEIAEEFVGTSFALYTAKIAARLGRELADDWDKPYESWYSAAFAADLTAIDGVADALDDIPVPVCVASNSSHGHLRRYLTQVGLHARFPDAIFSADDVEHGKPAPDLFLHAARTMGVAPERCAVVEDSPYGIQAARAAGMRAFGYYGGLTPAARLSGPGTVVFDAMADLPGLLGFAAGADRTIAR